MTGSTASAVVLTEMGEGPVNLSGAGQETTYVGQHYADSAVIYRGVLPVICACGILGIMLTVIVLSRKNMKTSTNCYLIALAIADLLFLIIFATYLPTKSPSLMQDSHAYSIFAIYISYAVILMNVFLISSSWLTVMLAIERYIAICRPFLAARVCTATKARVFIVLIFVLALLCRLPNFWELRIATAFNPETNQTVIYHEQTSLSFNEDYMAVYPWLVDGVLSSILPFLLLLVLNVRLIWEVRKSTLYIQRNMGGSSTGTIQREELQITVMLISVIIVFFICQAPYVSYTVVVSINKYELHAGPGFLLFRDLATMLLVLKSAVNFILYCWFSEKFWATLKKIFCLGRCLLRQRAQEGHPANYLHLRRFSSCATRESTF